MLEDLHWADEATLAPVRFLARRVESRPLPVVGTFRDDESSATAPLTVLLGELAPLAHVDRLQLPPLSPSGVTALVEPSGGRVAADRLHRRTGGNPFFVTEAVATPSAEVPATVRDAVLARMARLSAPARGVLVADPRTGDLSFRHELARETLEASIPPGERSRLHAVALAELLRAGSGDQHRLVHHAEGCGDGRAVLRHAVPAAERSARLGAHRESVELYRSALRFAALVPDPAETADLHERLSYECYLTNLVDEAIDARLASLDLLGRAVDRIGQDRAQRWLSWFAGKRRGRRPVRRARGRDAGAAGSLAGARHGVQQLRPARDAGRGRGRRRRMGPPCGRAGQRAG